MPEESLVQLPGSERAPLADATAAGPVDTTARAEVTLVLRRRAELPDEVVAGPVYITGEELAERYGADPADVALVTQTLQARGLEVTEVHSATRRIKVAGMLGDLSSAFGTTLQRVSSTDASGRAVTHRYREGPLYVPAALDGVVRAVLGLDTRPQAQPHFQTRGAVPGTSYPPNQVAEIYQFPPGTSGAGQTIAVIELGGGYSASDLDTYFSSLGITPAPSVTAVSVDGASNAPGPDSQGADIEVALDIEVIGGAAPGAAQVVYFAPNTDQGFIDAISDAVQASPAPIAISISWGQSEDSWSAQGLRAMDAVIADAAALGITLCAAAGSNGSSDGVADGQPHVDFPASSPNALGCGGTTLTLADSSTSVISSEVVWNEMASGDGSTGGGVSDQFAQPPWQANAGVPSRAGGPGTPWPGAGGRGVPDVAGNAAPVTGYQIYVGGQSQVVGGTSAAAALWSALIASLAEATGRRFGLIQPMLYAGAAPGIDESGFRDVINGNNGAYSAGPGWDACTGLGTPVGTALLTRLNS